jgi:glycosyl transferase, family 25
MYAHEPDELLQPCVRHPSSHTHRPNAPHSAGVVAVALACRWEASGKFDATRPDCAEGFPSVGSGGCFLSHLGVLRLILERGYKQPLVLEDDASFCREFRDNPEPWIRELNALPWDLCYFGGQTEAPVVSAGRFASCSVGVQTSHAYAVGCRVVPALVEYLEATLRRPPGHADGGPKHVDGAFTMFRERHPEVRTLIATPPIAIQRSSRSDIGRRGLWDRLPIVRDLATVARSLLK